MLQLIAELEFIQRGLLAGVLVGILCPIMGAFIVVRRLSLVSEALSHVTLAGVGFGLLVTQSVLLLQGINPLYIGVLFAIVGSFFIEQFRKSFKQYQELSIPIVLAGGLGIGIILVSMTNGFNASFLGILFGSIVSVTREDLYFISGTSAIIVVLLLIFYKEFFSLSFDEEYAKISGIPSRWMNILFAIMIALTISVAMRVVGLLLVSSMITLPVATSLRLAKSFKQLIFLAILFAQLSILSGIVVAYYLEVATGGMIVLMAVFYLLLSLIIQSITRRGFTRRTQHER